MTYCVGIKLNAGLVFLSDSRTNAGVDNISTYRKMIMYEKPGDRFMVLLSAGNLSISQSVREILQVEQMKDDDGDEAITIWNARSMFDACRILGQAVRHVYDRDAKSLQQAGVEFNVNLIFGGQIRGEGMRLFQVYSAATSSRRPPRRLTSRSVNTSTASRCWTGCSRPRPTWTKRPSARWCRWTPP